MDRILRAARAGQKFKVIVFMPAVPGFAGSVPTDFSSRYQPLSLGKNPREPSKI